MSGRFLAILCVSTFLSTVNAATSQEPAKQNPPAAPQAAEVKQAIGRALEYLRSRQTDKGNWVFERDVPESPNSKTMKLQEDPAFSLGLTALAALAMVENGVLPSDPAIQKAYAYIKEESVTNKRTYNLGLSILFLTRLGSREDRPLVQRLARRLMLGQHDSGGWPYDCPIDTERETARNPLQGFTRKAGIGDNSNTQFAVMGLWAASRAGVQVDEPLELVAKRFRGSQASSGGWDYQSTGKGDSNAMTTAGVYALTVHAAATSRKAAAADSASSSASKSKGKAADSSKTSDTPVPTTAKSALANDAIFQKGLTRVEQFAEQIGPGASSYFLWSVERLGVTLQMQTFGKVDWYSKGVKALLETQKSNGSWELGWKGPADTSFAMLFLRKAHLGRDISYALTGDASKPFVLLGQAQPQQFAKLSQAVAAAADGNTIEITGNGPFDIAGVTIAGKSLTIRAADGFEPVLAHKLELLQDPDREKDLRYGLAVRGSRLSLEGLRIQTDPDPRKKVAWTAIALDGGELRAVNCNFSQSNSTASAGIELAGGAKLSLLNCVVVGFTRAIEAVASADQNIQLENCLVYSRLGLMARGPNPKDSFGITAQLHRSTFHVAEVVNLAALSGAAEFDSEGNIFHTDTFSTGLRPSLGAPGSSVVRKWDGSRNVFDLTRWLTAGAQPIRDVKDLETWRKYWKTKEDGSYTRSVPFAKNHQVGPFPHNTNPNDWRPTIDRLTPDHDPDVQIGCDVYLVGSGQAYFQFKETAAYETWCDTDAGVGSASQSTNGTAPPDASKLLDGTWLPVEAILNGQKFSEEVLKTMKLIVKGGQYTVQVGPPTDQGTLKLDPTKTPKVMDIAGTEGPNKGKTILTIYELNGDSLKVCYALKDGERPTVFESKPDTNLLLVTYMRE